MSALSNEIEHLYSVLREGQSEGASFEEKIEAIFDALDTIATALDAIDDKFRGLAS